MAVSLVGLQLLKPLHVADATCAPPPSPQTHISHQSVAVGVCQFTAVRLGRSLLHHGVAIGVIHHTWQQAQTLKLGTCAGCKRQQQPMRCLVCKQVHARPAHINTARRCHLQGVPIWEAYAAIAAGTAPVIGAQQHLVQPCSMLLTCSRVHVWHMLHAGDAVSLTPAPPTPPYCHNHCCEPETCQTVPSSLGRGLAIPSTHPMYPITHTCNLDQADHLGGSVPGRESLAGAVIT
jgi:hypothetical protein